MSKILSFDNMISVASDVELPGYDTFVARAEQLASDLAEALAEHLSIEAGEAMFTDGEMLVSFRPTSPEQKCPAAIDGFDDGGEWEYVGAVSSPASM